jgi:hypothetical protein
MDNLSKEQLLLLQQNLTYEQYEQFMSMFNEEDETLPKNINERNAYILNTMKNHEYWGKIHGWGENRVYCHLPKRKHILIEDTGPHDVYSMFKGETRKELLKFLDEYKKYTPATYIPSECMEVEKEEKFEDQKSSEYQQPQMPMINSWIDDDDIRPIKLERHNAIDFHQ